MRGDCDSTLGHDTQDKVSTVITRSNHKATVFSRKPIQITEAGVTQAAGADMLKTKEM